MEQLKNPYINTCHDEALTIIVVLAGKDSIGAQNYIR
jgi:hypothetical protein